MKITQYMRKIARWSLNLMWLPFITLMIGVFTMPEGEYALSEMPPLSRYSLIAVQFFFAVWAVLTVGTLLLGGLERRSILNGGQTATAKIIKVWQTGTFVNENPVVGLLLEVQPPNQPAFQAETQRVIPLIQIPQLQPGTTMSVKYDPNSHAVTLLN